MFRITPHTDGDEVVLKLEGALTGPWVEELDACWRAATSTTDGRRLRVDLRDVCRVDDAGRRLMAAMHQAGARFVTRGCVMPELVREIVEREAARRN